ncbi:MAG TPA: glycosyltransferase [Candidatus Goldiibacteriota bacterium]|nr:glycosyltransferase [Candidatus Goldiibacteriota bacterium]
MNFKKLSVLMPMYNEELYAAANILETDAYLRKLNIKYEIIVMDDGSKDRTFRKASKAAQKHIKIYRLKVNEGKGQALKEAFRKSDGDLIMFLDGDLDIHPKQFEALFKEMNEKNADVVIGSKRHPLSVLNYPKNRRIMSSVYFFIVKLLFGLPLRDTQTGIKLFRREALSRTFHKVLIKRYAFDLELLVLCNYYGFKITEAPVVVDYKGKFGHIKPSTVFNMLWDTLTVFYRLKILKYYDKIS